jgi:hypothetical protein
MCGNYKNYVLLYCYAVYDGFFIYFLIQYPVQG